MNKIDLFFFFIWQVRENEQEVCWLSLGQLISDDRSFIIIMVIVLRSLLNNKKRKKKDGI